MQRSNHARTTVGRESRIKAKSTLRVVPVAQVAPPVDGAIARQLSFFGRGPGSHLSGPLFQVLHSPFGCDLEQLGLGAWVKEATWVTSFTCERDSFPSFSASVVWGSETSCSAVSRTEIASP